MNYQECLAYLQRHCQKGVPGGLARTKRMAELLGNPQETLQTIHIAGTNGKGSTAAMIAAVLRAAGYRVGLFTSPHLERYEERIQINGQLIEEGDFAEIFTYLIKAVIPQLLAEGMAHPGEFELLTVAGWLYFQEKTDFVVSEVGLGGTMDPTNLVQHPVLTIITSVSLDHCQLLGHTVGEIAGEKAGIIKAGVPVIIAPQEAEAFEVIVRRAAQLQAPVIAVQRDALRPVATNLKGMYQQINGNVALAALENLQQRGIIAATAEQLAKGLHQVVWPGRMEYLDLGGKRAILLDGAHNPAGIACLAENLRTLYGERQIVLFLSILDDKEQISMLQEILPLATAVVLTKPEHDQRAQHWQQMAQSIGQLAPHCPCVLYKDYREGLRQTLAQLLPGQLLCITGSLYLLGDCRRFLSQVLF